MKLKGNWNAVMSAVVTQSLLFLSSISYGLSPILSHCPYAQQKKRGHMEWAKVAREAVTPFVHQGGEWQMAPVLLAVK